VKILQDMLQRGSDSGRLRLRLGIRVCASLDGGGECGEMAEQMVVTMFRGRA
jgi:hypothetical protein